MYVLCKVANKNVVFLIKIEMAPSLFWHKYDNKFHQNPLSGVRVLTCTDKQTKELQHRSAGEILGENL
jgi:hypothetical protein